MAWNKGVGLMANPCFPMYRFPTTNSLFQNPITATATTTNTPTTTNAIISCCLSLRFIIKKTRRSNKISSSWSAPPPRTRKRQQHVCKAGEYVFPDPIPEFAHSETDKFRTHLLKKLSKKDIYGESVEEVVGICTEIFSNFLHTEYGGPGTLLVIPFIDMADTLNERGLPGGPQAARAAVVWAQEHVDKDWNKWTEGGGNSH
eukprot:TRINITY_DN25777_c0_g1_i1.p1 TRINITY_DN25777_c0_g1~~TRINITY_DN25777_c0_g1_i1.p1  ORF type:complete len:202 (-),score=23.55 TRINITY_DN25777_c0_g1_i1:362-967(-)